MRLVISTNVIINNVVLIAVIDTGCVISTMHINTAKKCKIDNLINNIFVWHTDLIIYNTKCVSNFVINPNYHFDFDIILGINFLNINKICLNFKYNIISSISFCEPINYNITNKL